MQSKAKIVSLLASMAILSAAASSAPDSDGFAAWRNKPTERFTEGRKNFEAAMSLLRQKYQDRGLSEDELYNAATRGLLENIDLGSDWDKLLSPSELKELTVDLEGAVVGIGVEFEFDDKAGIGLIHYVIPESAAAAAGVRAGDRILKVDGADFRGKQLRDMVYAIRGPAGKGVDLRILRDDHVLSVRVARKKLDWNAVDHRVIEPGTGLLTIQQFTKKTPAAVAAALQSLAKQGAERLIVDLRGNSGGGFTDAMAVASLLLPEGKPIVTVVQRGGKEKLLVADPKEYKLQPPALAPRDVVVLINGETSSGAELLAAALRSSYEARLVGASTLGKWNGQTVEKLPNGFAVKFTTMVFRAPDGETYGGRGVSPDVEVAMDASQLRQAQRLKESTARLEADEQLRTALNLLK